MDGEDTWDGSRNRQECIIYDYKGFWIQLEVDDQRGYYRLPVRPHLMGERNKDSLGGQEMRRLKVTKMDRGEE